MPPVFHYEVHSQFDGTFSPINWIKGAEVGMERAMRVVQKAAYDNLSGKLVKKRTGQLRSALRRRVVEQGNDRLVGEVSLSEVGNRGPSRAPLIGFWLEYGTKPHLILPKNAKVLRFTVGKKVVFASRVNHPGIKARHWLASAGVESEPKVTKILGPDLIAYVQAMKMVGK